jgi:flagellin-like protein
LRKKSFLAKRRGISELIGTLLLLGITTTGSVFLATIVQGSGLASIQGSSVTPVSPPYSIRLVGYDTRDGANLADLGTLDNKADKKLCTDSCSLAPNNIPANDGTDFIAIQIKNVSTNPVFIRNIQINGITHDWDSQTGGNMFDASADNLLGNYPLNGKFSMVSSNGVQKSDNEIADDEEVQLIVKLSEDFSSDILLSKPIQVLVDFGGTRATEFVVLSGDAK